MHYNIYMIIHDIILYIVWYLYRYIIWCFELGSLWGSTSMVISAKAISLGKWSWTIQDGAPSRARVNRWFISGWILWFMVDISRTRFHGDYFMVYKPNKHHWGAPHPVGFQMISGCNWHDSSNMSWLYHVTSRQDNLEAPMVTYGHLCHRPRFFHHFSHPKVTTVTTRGNLMSRSFWPTCATPAMQCIFRCMRFSEWHLALIHSFIIAISPTHYSDHQHRRRHHHHHHHHEDKYGYGSIPINTIFGMNIHSNHHWNFQISSISGWFHDFLDDFHWISKYPIQFPSWSSFGFWPISTTST